MLVGEECDEEAFVTVPFQQHLQAMIVATFHQPLGILMMHSPQNNNEETTRCHEVKANPVVISLREVDLNLEALAEVHASAVTLYNHSL